MNYIEYNGIETKEKVAELRQEWEDSPKGSFKGVLRYSVEKAVLSPARQRTVYNVGYLYSIGIALRNVALSILGFRIVFKFLVKRAV